MLTETLGFVRCTTKRYGGIGELCRKLNGIMNTASKTVVGGLVATAAMTALVLMAPMMGIPQMDIGAMVAGMLRLPTAIGWVMHVMIGILFAFGYTYLLSPRLPVPKPFLRGMVYGFIVFLLAQILFFLLGIMELMPDSPMEDSGLALLGSLMGHLVYGGVLGAVLDRQTEPLRSTA